jgi:hypothetical protein
MQATRGSQRVNNTSGSTDALDSVLGDLSARCANALDSVMLITGVSELHTGAENSTDARLNKATVSSSGQLASSRRIRTDTAARYSLE